MKCLVLDSDHVLSSTEYAPPINHVSTPLLEVLVSAAKGRHGINPMFQVSSYRYVRKHRGKKGGRLVYPELGLRSAS